ncbi:unnamed protein product [Musa acuminata subsp. malaccensis]|uniref:(wild Malaysian banana) hypothetical protein n=1 Tax=Musa acuminata subsp. malaccensis TaxID=214687 RepID=A0A8D6ZRY1_MUSAM|nr:unnamed protein product [Musa acuminata subsp. malaccensis]
MHLKETTSSSTEPLLPSRASYAHSLSRIDDKFMSFRHVVVFWSLFLLLSIFVPTASRFILAWDPTRRTYDYLYLFAFVRCYGVRRFLFIDKLVEESKLCFVGEVAYKV